MDLGLLALIDVKDRAAPAPIWPGALVSVAVPGKWVLHVHPDHPAYPDLIAYEFSGWPAKALRDFLAQPGVPHVAAEYAKVALARKRG